MAKFYGPVLHHFTPQMVERRIGEQSSLLAYRNLAEIEKAFVLQVLSE